MYISSLIRYIFAFACLSYGFKKRKEKQMNTKNIVKQYDKKKQLQKKSINVERQTSLFCSLKSKFVLRQIMT